MSDSEKHATQFAHLSPDWWRVFTATLTGLVAATDGSESAYDAVGVRAANITRQLLEEVLPQENQRLRKQDVERRQALINEMCRAAELSESALLGCVYINELFTWAIAKRTDFAQQPVDLLAYVAEGAFTPAAVGIALSGWANLDSEGASSTAAKRRITAYARVSGYTHNTIRAASAAWTAPYNCVPATEVMATIEKAYRLWYSTLPEDQHARFAKCELGVG